MKKPQAIEITAKPRHEAFAVAREDSFILPACGEKYRGVDESRRCLCRLRNLPDTAESIIQRVNAERPREKAVHAGGDAALLILGTGTRRQRDDPEMAAHGLLVLANLASNVETIALGQVKIEQEKVEAS